MEVNLHRLINDVNYTSHNIVDRVERAFGGSKLAGDAFKIGAGLGIPLALGYGLHRYVSARHKLKEKIPMKQLKHGGNIISRVLNNHNIRFAFSLNELDEINTIVESKFENKMSIIQMKNYNNAIVAASGVFRMTGQIGVIFCASSPDIITMINGIISAKYENIPLIVIAIKPILNENYYDKKVLKNYFKHTYSIKNIGDISNVLEEGLSKTLDSENAYSVFIEVSQSLLLPEDQTKEIIENYQKSRWYFNRLWDEFSGRFKYPAEDDEISFHYPKIRPIENPKNRHVDNVLKKLLESKNPILIVGDQCLVSNNISNKDLNIESLKLSIQLLGIPTYLHGFSKCLGTNDIRNIVNDNMSYAIEHCDLLICIGVSSPSFLQDLNINTFKTPVYSIEEFQLPLIGHNKLGIDFINRYACDPSGFLLHLGFVFPKAFTNRWNNWLFDLKEKDSIASLLIEKKGEIKVDHINPHLLIKSLKDTFKRLEKPPVIVSDKGDFCDYANITLGGSVLSWVQSSKFSSNGSSIGLAIASKLCFPETDVFMLCDEKSITNCVQEFGTLSRYHLPINIIVGNSEKSIFSNIHYNQDIVNLQSKQQQQLLHQQQMLDHAKHNENQRTAYHKIMNAYGGKGFIISHNDSTKDDIEKILFDAREKSNSLNRPVLINCWVDTPKNIIGSGSM
ncbi:hypothetical protein DICPUDRAFT_157793 [Dictyostelium purpureum]|uniref:2-hydroxyacyl-CoA lyase n=1 Tax=Dictyostelium purpureum TaxID=5786 RepID=F1A007_DICPU|nr:uncharacterized protein DICPUDRAFT_157793 [Dictyostelium purpureum]EGC30474.1 hypothetical protein DICPUDRAFT_157793 [Dictyostelium purpureum]|eukprot:XP_003293003.1 hypothetical protein DICPUDRAFT_157793 [Dictyostelium purpureum]